GCPCAPCRSSGSGLRARARALWLPYWMPAGSRVHAAEDIACLPRVAAHLRDQRRQVGEFFFVTEPGDELDLDPATVQVAVEIEQVRLQQRLHAADRGPGAEARHRRPWRIA